MTDDRLPLPVPCPSEKPHKPHVWDEAEETLFVWAEEELEAQRNATFTRHWCNGSGHLRGLL